MSSGRVTRSSLQGERSARSHCVIEHNGSVIEDVHLLATKLTSFQAFDLHEGLECELYAKVLSYVVIGRFISGRCGLRNKNFLDHRERLE